MLITICSSVAFYKQVIDVEAELVRLGHKVIVPQTVNTMKQSGNFSVENQKSWFKTGDYSLKTKLMEDHFREIEKGESILVVNLEKNGIKGYIGGNVLMEMTVAFYLQKPIYIFHPISEDLPIKEEIYGMQPVFLKGDLERIPLKV